MKKIERRAVLCLVLAGLLLAGLALFLFRFFSDQVIQKCNFSEFLVTFFDLPCGTTYDFLSSVCLSFYSYRSSA